ncbi:MAG: DUF1926 domain-containing protein [Nitrospiraceae bacterium]|nr:DUF1926 domain-containing protein [Nitrospiraceae bacterium]
MPKLNLILAIHNHQPVGNFDNVLEDSYKKAYLPFLEKLLAYKSLRFVLHYSGNILLWLNDNHPEAVDIIKTLLKENRIELLSGGIYEPIFASIPETDRIMQIEEMTDYIKEIFRVVPKGMWLPERVWEPNMPKYIAQAGIEYLPVDDHHFKLSGLKDKELFGYYITEEQGNYIKIFPGSEKLRYWIPFRDVSDIIEYLREVHKEDESRLLTMADDGEKFGVWPDTYKHCYEDGWLDKFFSALEENKEWIETTTFDEYQKKFYPLGRAYLPAASYREMGEWSLPLESAKEYENLLSEMEKIFGDSAKGFLRGGIWRSFFAKYPESNHINKRMLGISKKVHDAANIIKKKKTDFTGSKALLHELWKGQCNDAYWHGIFGGLYLPHLRSALYRHLIKAESMAEKILADESITKQDVFFQEGDIDCDGYKDILISTKTMSAFFTENSGALTELSVKRQNINVLDILTRRPEAYHTRISETANSIDNATKTIHNRIFTKEQGLKNVLVYDNYRRASLLDHFLNYDVKIDDLINSSYIENGDFINGHYEIESNIDKSRVRLFKKGAVFGEEMRIEKLIGFNKSGIRVDYLLEGKYNGIFGVEFNLSFLGSSYTAVNLRDSVFYIKDKGLHETIDKIVISDEISGLKMEFVFDENIDFCHYPVETISLSENGIERIYQGTEFLFMNKIELTDKKKIGFTINIGE